MPFRVMVVDDDRDGADAIATILRSWGYAVRVVHDAPSALDDASMEPPDLVLSDIHLPGMSGFSLAEELAGKMPLIATTGDTDDRQRQRSYEAGFQHHFVKPLDLNALQRTLEHLRKAG